VPLLAVVVGAVSLYLGAESPASSREVAAPELFSADEPCPDRNPATAGHRAHESERIAHAKQQRFPFDRTDGLHAALRLAEARACYRLAGQSEAEQRAATDLKRWQGHMNEEYAALRLQLRLALDQSRTEDALTAVKALQTLLPEEPGEYSDWLSQLRRELEGRIAKARS
jgi:hypothetical protein